MHKQGLSEWKVIYDNDIVNSVCFSGAHNLSLFKGEWNVSIVCLPSPLSSTHYMKTNKNTHSEYKEGTRTLTWASL